MLPPGKIQKILWLLIVTLRVNPEGNDSEPQIYKSYHSHTFTTHGVKFLQVCFSGSQFESIQKLNMADSLSDSTPMYEDSSGNEFVPNSASGSDTESEEYDTAAAKSTKAKNKKKEELQQFDAEMDVAVARKHGCKRSNSHLNSCGNELTRSKMKRNTTHASKISCCDVAVVKACLSSGKECCSHKCLQKMAKFGNEAVGVLSELRHRRFAGTLLAPCLGEKITNS